MTDKPKGQRMFAAVGKHGHIRHVYYFARRARIEIGEMWADGRKSETWEDGWKRAKCAGIRIVPVIVTVEDRHD